MDVVEERETHTCINAIGVPSPIKSEYCKECGILVHYGTMFYHTITCSNEYHERYFENKWYCQNCILKKVKFKTWEVASTRMGITTYKTFGDMEYWINKCKTGYYYEATRIPYYIVAPRVAVKSARK